MGVYSNIELSEINEILSYYDLGVANSFVPTMTGISNSNFKVSMDGGQDVLLKISNDKTIEQLNNEQHVLTALADHKFEFALTPFQTIQGKPIYQHNDYYGVVFPFIDGLPPTIDSDVCFQVGSALAKLHSLDITKEDLEHIRPHDVVGFGSLDIKEYLDSPDAASDFREDFNTVFPDNLENIPYDVFPVGIIHGDLYFDNSLFKDGKLVTLIDFEQSGRGRFILDIGIAISGTCLNEDRSNVDEEYLKSFMQGYESIRSLKIIEKEYLDKAILVGFFSIALWRIKRFLEGDLDSSKKYNYRELTQRAKNYKRVFI
jgi:homoserine kinase type II